jgi:hypothetical protein
MKTSLLAFVAVVLGVTAGGLAACWRLGFSLGSDPLAVSAVTRIADLQSSQEGLPVVDLDRETAEFGHVVAGAPVKADFTIYNRGKGPLRLFHGPGDSTCRCVVGTVSRDPIPPGGQVTIHLEVKSESEMGPFRQTATIHTNDPQRPRVVLTLLGEFAPPLSASPYDLVFSSLGQRDTRTAHLFLLSHEEQEFSVVRYEILDPALAPYFDVTSQPATLEEAKATSAKSACRVLVTVKPGLPLGRFQTTLRLTTDLKQSPTVEVPMSGQIVGDIVVTGPGWNAALQVLHLFRVRRGEGLRKTIHLQVRNSPAEGIEVHVVNTDPPSLNVTVEPARSLSGGSVLLVPLVLEIPKDARPIDRSGPTPDLQGHILLETNHPTVKQMRINVSVEIVN